MEKEASQKIRALQEMLKKASEAEAEDEGLDEKEPRKDTPPRIEDDMLSSEAEEDSMDEEEEDEEEEPEMEKCPHCGKPLGKGPRHAAMMMILAKGKREKPEGSEND